MKIYSFAKISARAFPTRADLDNPWIFPSDVTCVANLSERYDPVVAELLAQRGIRYDHFPLQEEVPDIGWETIKQAVSLLLRYEREGGRMVVHCDFGQHRSRLVVEALHYALRGCHLEDSYKGHHNHLIYNCSTHHLPPLAIVEQELTVLE